MDEIHEETNTESERRLAYIATITDIQPIEGADRIERVTINEGWHCVAKKSEFMVGSLTCFIEVDSIVPKVTWSEFLINKDKPDKPIRIRSIRLRGTVSQGIALPLSILKDYPQEGFPVGFEDGMNLTEVLGITHYEPPVSGSGSMGGEARGSYPSFLFKSDETRIQSLYSKLKYKLNDDSIKLYATEKVDGSNFTAYFKGGVFGVCSRNIDLRESEFNKFWMLARKYNLREKLESIGGNIAIKGEMAGPGIQSNKLKLSEVELFLFDVFNIDEGKYVSLEGLRGYARLFDLRTAPIVAEGFKFSDFSDVDEWVEYSITHSIINRDAWAEGIVVRPVNYDILNYSFKVINPEFSLKYE